jgi:tRNA(Arg) A34 adenosine deaminase TadA
MINLNTITKILQNSQLANQNKIEHPSKYVRQRVTMISIIFKGNSILAIGENNYDRKQYPFKWKNKYKSYSGLHSELDAINKCNKHQLKGATIAIYGLRRINMVTSTFPCASCLNAIKDVGIKKIIYWKDNVQHNVNVTEL